MCQEIKFNAEKYFNSLNMFGIRLGLDATRELLKKAGNPEKNLRFLHLAGTNGKGSTGAMLERALRSVGLKTGFYTSPHLIDTRERFRVNGRAISTERFNTATKKLKKAAGDGSYSYFEFATVLAVKIFQEEQVDVVIWETGMGGRLDATNAVMPECSIITNIAYDHQKSLGSTLTAIATEKAGIIKPKRPVFVGFLPEEASEVIRVKAAELGCELFTPTPPQAAKYRAKNGLPTQFFRHDGFEVELPLIGTMQRRNFALVYEVLKYFSKAWNFSLPQAIAGVAKCRWPGRIQMISPKIIIDGGHNPDGITALREAVQEVFPEEKFTIVYGGFQDKDVAPSLAELSQIAASFIFTPLGVEGRPSHAPSELVEMAKKLNVRATASDDIISALKQAEQLSPRIIAAGSLFLVGKILNAYNMIESALNLT